MIPTNVLLIPLFSRLAVNTTGVALGKRSLDLNLPQIRTLLHQASAIWLVGVTEHVASTDLEWNVAFYSGFDRDHQPTSPTDIAAANFTSSSSHGQRSADYTTTTNFLLESRLQVWWRNPSGITGVNNGLISGALGLRLST